MAILEVSSLKGLFFQSHHRVGSLISLEEMPTLRFA